MNSLRFQISLSNSFSVLPYFLPSNISTLTQEEEQAFVETNARSEISSYLFSNGGLIQYFSSTFFSCLIYSEQITPNDLPILSNSPHNNLFICYCVLFWFFWGILLVFCCFTSVSTFRSKHWPDFLVGKSVTAVLSEKGEVQVLPKSKAILYSKHRGVSLYKYDIVYSILVNMEKLGGGN